jgi:hypothetical protein
METIQQDATKVVANNMLQINMRPFLCRMDDIFLKISGCRI